MAFLNVRVCGLSVDMKIPVQTSLYDLMRNQNLLPQVFLDHPGLEYILYPARRTQELISNPRDTSLIKDLQGKVVEIHLFDRVLLTLLFSRMEEN